MSPLSFRPVAVLVRLVMFAAAATTIACLAVAGPAHAHASVSSTEPRADARVTALPDRIVIHVIKKQATRAGDPIQVYDPDGVRIDSAETLISDGGGTISVGIRPGTRRSGTYNVEYKITSADTHIIHDRFTFSLIPLSNEPLNSASSGGTVRTNAPSALAATTARLRLVGPPGGSYLGVGLVLAALVALVVMVARRRRHPVDMAAPGFRVVSTGEHRLGPVAGPELPPQPSLPPQAAPYRAAPAPGPLGSARSVALPRTGWSERGNQPLHPSPGTR
jgi:methionine-rich copper-binding protein CopC